jgi:hypothetical protein
MSTGRAIAPQRLLDETCRWRCAWRRPVEHRLMASVGLRETYTRGDVLHHWEHGWQSKLRLQALTLTSSTHCK